MALPPDELLSAIATTLRGQIGPAVGEPFAQTQAFMAAVILEKLAGQLKAGAGDDVADRERAELVADLRAMPTGSAAGAGSAAAGSGAAGLPAAVDAAVDGLGVDGSDERWRALVAALYAERAALGPERFDALLARVRLALRARLDRTLAYAS